ncbi:MAG: hypothetical protein AAFP86_22545, partial [Planctomycetota bacterium]
PAPIASPTHAPAENAATLGLAEAKRADIESRLSYAAARPRNEDAAMERLFRACNRPTLAAKAEYSIPRKKDGEQIFITGPSVHLAREAARCFGHIEYGFEELPSEDGWIHFRAYAWDLETNARVFEEDRFSSLVPKKVWQNRQYVRTDYVEPTEQQRRELIARRASIKVRNCILNVIPADVIDEAIMRAKMTLRVKAKKELGERREEIILSTTEVFAELGVSAEMLDAHLGKSLVDMDADDLNGLRSLHRAILDGQTSVADAFGEKDEPEVELASEDAPKSGMAQQAAAGDAKGDEAEKAAEEPAEEPKKAPAKKKAASRKKPAAEPKPDDAEGAKGMTTAALVTAFAVHDIP